MLCNAHRLTDHTFQHKYRFFLCSSILDRLILPRISQMDILYKTARVCVLPLCFHIHGSSRRCILAYSRREDPRDVLIYKSEKKEQGTEEGSILTKTGAVIGTSSKRRMIQIQKLYPNAVFQGIRGNIQTRLSKLNKEEYDAAVLAAAGVKRLNMEAVIGRYFSVDEVIPAAGQGILAVQGRKEFLKDTVWRQYVDDKKSRVQALAERSFIRVLDGGCTSPSAAYAKVKGNELELTGLYYNEKSGQYFVKKAASYIEDASSLGERLALTMKKQFGER